MPQFDPSVISDIGGSGPDIAGSMAKAFSLKDLIDHEQLNKLKINSEKQDLADQQNVRQIMSKSDLSTDKGLADARENLNKAGQWKQSLEVGRYAQDVRNGVMQERQAHLQYHLEIQNYIDSKVGEVVNTVGAYADAKKPDGTPLYDRKTVDAMANAQFAKAVADVQNDPDTDNYTKKTILLGVGRFMSGAAPGQAPQPGQPPGQTQPVSYERLVDAYRATAAGKKQISDALAQLNVKSEIAHRSADEEQGQERIGIDRQKLDLAKKNQGSFDGDRSALLAALVEKGVPLTAGFRSRAQQQATLDGLIARNPGKSMDEIADLVGSGQITFGAERKETQTAAAIGGKVSVGENELIDFAPKALAISDKVNRGDFVPYNRLKQMGERNISDPDLKELYGRTNAILNAYDVVASRGGTDKEKRAENRKNLETADSPAAYRRAVETMMDEAKLAKGAARRAEGRDNSGSTGSGPAKVTSDADYAKLPSGTEFIGPDGKTRKKP
jgi:hypothetical protein